MTYYIDTNQLVPCLSNADWKANQDDKACISMFVLSEVARLFSRNPFSTTGRRICKVLLDYTDWTLLPDMDEALLAEFENPGSGTIPPESRNRCDTNSFLKSCYDGVPPNLRLAEHAHYEKADHQMREFVRESSESPDVDLIRHLDWNQFYTFDHAEYRATVLVYDYFVKRGVWPPAGNVKQVAQCVAAKAKGVPAWAGATRMNSFSQWYVSKHKSIGKRFRHDLKFLTSSLHCDVVLTRDKQVLHWGPKIFPEVGFRNPSSS